MKLQILSIKTKLKFANSLWKLETKETVDTNSKLNKYEKCLSTCAPNLTTTINHIIIKSVLWLNRNILQWCKNII